MNRKTALKVIALMCAALGGRRLHAQQKDTPSESTSITNLDGTTTTFQVAQTAWPKSHLAFELDAFADIRLSYGGKSVVIKPEEIWEALNDKEFTISPAASK